MVITTHKDSTMMHDDYLLKNTKVTVGYLEINPAILSTYINQHGKLHMLKSHACTHQVSLMVVIILPVLLMIPLPSPRRNTLPSFSQRMFGAGMPVNVHTSSKRIPSVLVSGAGRLTMVG